MFWNKFFTFSLILTSTAGVLWPSLDPQKASWQLYFATTLEYAKQLVEQEHADINYKLNGEDSVLCNAIGHGYVDIADYLIEKGAKVNEPGYWGYTPLWKAVDQGLTAIVKKLLSSGANVNEKRRYDSGEEETLLHLAIDRRYIDTIKTLIESGADITIKSPWFHEPPLYHVVEKGNVPGMYEVIELLVKNGADVNATDHWYSHKTHLRRAIEKWYGDTIKTLIHCGANVKEIDSDGNSLFSRVVRRDDAAGLQDIIKLFVEKGADVNQKSPLDGETCLRWAVENGKIETIKTLVACHADVNERGLLEETCLHWAVKNGKIETAKTLVECHADVNATDTWRWGPRDYAIAKGDKELDQYLAAHGAQIHHPGRNLAIGLAVAATASLAVYAYQKRHSIFAWWYGYEMDALLKAAENGSLQEVKKLVGQWADVNVKNELGQTALHLAVAAGKLDIIQYLIEKCGANINEVDNAGNTPLHVAAMHRRHQIVEYLVRTGKATINKGNNSGNTPLYLAVEQQDANTVICLAGEGEADLTWLNGAGKTPVDIANEEMKKYLRIAPDFYAVVKKKLAFDAFAKKHLINANMVVYFDAKTLYEKIKATKQLNEQKLEEVKKYLENVALNFETDNKAKVFAKYAEEYLVNERVIRHANLTDVYNLLHLGTKEFFDEFVEFTKKYKLLNFGDEDGNEKEWMLFDCAWRIDPKKIDPKEDFWFKECCQLLGDKKTEFDATVGESINKLRQEEEEARKSLEIGDPKKLERAKSEDLKKVKNMILQQKTGYLNIPKNIRMPNVEVKKEPGDDSKKKLINVKIDFKFKEPQL